MGISQVVKRDKVVEDVQLNVIARDELEESGDKPLLATELEKKNGGCDGGDDNE